MLSTCQLLLHLNLKGDLDFILMANWYLKYNLAKIELLVHSIPHKQDTCCFLSLPYFFKYPHLPTYSALRPTSP